MNTLLLVVCDQASTEWHKSYSSKGDVVFDQPCATFVVLYEMVVGMSACVSKTETWSSCNWIRHCQIRLYTQLC